MTTLIRSEVSSLLSIIGVMLSAVVYAKRLRWSSVTKRLVAVD